MIRNPDLPLLLCAFGIHRPVLMREGSIYPGDHVTYRRCARCLRNPDRVSAYR